MYDVLLQNDCQNIQNQEIKNKFVIMMYNRYINRAFLTDQTISHFIVLPETKNVQINAIKIK